MARPIIKMIVIIEPSSAIGTEGGIHKSKGQSRLSPSNYTLHGQLTNEVQNGVAIARSYDSLGRPTGYTLNPVHPVNPVGTTYDPIGNRTSATCYDEQGEAVASAYVANARRWSKDDAEQPGVFVSRS